MPNERTLSEKNRYYVPKESYLTAIHYCRQYPLWIIELEMEYDTRKAITYDGDRVQTSGGYDSTSETAMRQSETRRKVEVIESTAKTAAGDLWKWIIKGTCYNLTYYQLKEWGIPCGKNIYYQMRRRFYYEISKKI